MSHRPFDRPRSTRPRLSDHDPEYPPTSYNQPHPSSRHRGHGSSIIPMSTSHLHPAHYEDISGSSNRRPTTSRQRSGGGYGGNYGCGTGECGGDYYEPVMERPRRELYGMGGRRRAYDVDERDDW